MTEMERLIELIKEGARGHTFMPTEFIAEYLLANGVVCPPCKVGDTVYRIWSVGKHGKSIADFVVTKVAQITERSWVVGYQKRAKNLYSTPRRYQCNFEDFGKTVFITQEEAEKALAERSRK